MKPGQRPSPFFRLHHLPGWLIVAHLAGCSLEAATGSDAPTGEQPSSVASSVGQEGGALSLSKVSVEIPPGALQSNVDIVVDAAPDDALVEEPLGVSFIDAPVAFLPHGTRFEECVSVRLHYDPTVSPEAVYRLADPEDQDWEIVEGATFDRGVASFCTSGFSYYAVGGLDEATGSTGGASAASGGASAASGGASAASGGSSSQQVFYSHDGDVVVDEDALFAGQPAPLAVRLSGRATAQLTDGPSGSSVCVQLEVPADATGQSHAELVHQPSTANVSPEGDFLRAGFEVENLASSSLNMKLLGANGAHYCAAHYYDGPVPDGKFDFSFGWNNFVDCSTQEAFYADGFVTDIDEAALVFEGLSAADRSIRFCWSSAEFGHDILQ